MANATLICRHCDIEKPIESFCVERGRAYATCRSCYNQRQADRRQTRRIAEGLPTRNPNDWFNRFLGFIPDRGDDDCWEWQGDTSTTKGYGRISVFGKSRPAHRLSFALHNGHLDADAFICHRCDNPPCVNPRHLYAGDAESNNTDARARDHWKPMKGEANGAAHLTQEQVEEIRALYATGRYYQRFLAERFGICQAQVSNIVRGQHWREVS